MTLTFLALAAAVTGALIATLSLLLSRRLKNGRHEKLSGLLAEEVPHPLTLGEARQHLAHSDTSKKAQEYLHKVAPQWPPSVLEACLIALFPLGFTFLIVLMAAGSTQAWWIDQQFRVLGTTTNATLTD